MEKIIDSVSDIATIFAFLLAIFGFWYAVKQFNQYKKTEQARFWLDLRKMFKEHDEVHQRLRNPEDWRSSRIGPVNNDEWAKVEAYMGLFELCNILIKRNLIDIEIFKTQYEYRIRNILSNEVIRQKKLIDAKEGWKEFIELVKKLDLCL